MYTHNVLLACLSSIVGEEGIGTQLCSCQSSAVSGGGLVVCFCLLLVGASGGTYLQSAERSPHLQAGASLHFLQHCTAAPPPRCFLPSSPTHCLAWCHGPSSTRLARPQGGRVDYPPSTHLFLPRAFFYLVIASTMCTPRQHQP